MVFGLLLMCNSSITDGADLADFGSVHSHNLEVQDGPSSGPSLAPLAARSATRNNVATTWAMRPDMMHEVMLLPHGHMFWRIQQCWYKIQDKEHHLSYL